jgi:hypothetical protein
MFESNYGIEKMALYHGEAIRGSIERGIKRPRAAREERIMRLSLIQGTLTFNGIVYALGDRR